MLLMYMWCAHCDVSTDIMKYEREREREGRDDVIMVYGP